MTLDEFTNGLRTLRSLAGTDLSELGFSPFATFAFRENPHAVFLDGDSELRNALWPFIERANIKRADRDMPAPLNPSSVVPPDHRRAERDEARLRIREIVIEELAKQNEAAKSKESA